MRAIGRPRGQRSAGATIALPAPAISSEKAAFRPQTVRDVGCAAFHPQAHPSLGAAFACQRRDLEWRLSDADMREGGQQFLTARPLSKKNGFRPGNILGGEHHPRAGKYCLLIYTAHDLAA